MTIQQRLRSRRLQLQYNDDFDRNNVLVIKVRALLNPYTLLRERFDQQKDGRVWPKGPRKAYFSES